MHLSVRCFFFFTSNYPENKTTYQVFLVLFLRKVVLEKKFCHLYSIFISKAKF